MEILPGLDTFVLVGRTGSISGAARALGVPRSTVSRRLARLESELGEVLLDRSSRSAHLTEAGRLLLERGAPLVAALRSLEDDVRQLGGEPRGAIRVCAMPGLGIRFLSEFLRGLRERWPDLRPELLVREHPPSLLDEGFDVVITESSSDPGPYHVHVLGPADRVVVTHPGRLREQAPRLADLAALPCLGVDGPADRADLWPLRNGESVPVRPALRSNDLTVVREAALSGLGFALLPLFAVGLDLLGGDLVIALPEVGRSATLVALTSRPAEESPKVAAFLSLVEEFRERYAGPEIDRLVSER